jgi:putative NADH-flavin reductase
VIRSIPRIFGSVMSTPVADSASAGDKQLLVLFGATGATGSHLLTKALAQGNLRVRAFVRTPSKLSDAVTANPDLEVVQGSLDDLSAVDSAMIGADFVISCAGDKTASKNGFMEKFMKQVIVSARKHSVKRVLYQAGAFSPVPGLKTPLMGKVLSAVAGPVMGLSAMIRDNTAVINALFDAKDLEWVITRPGMLKESPSTGKVKVVEGLSKPISFVDLAEFNLMAVQTNQYNHTAPFLAY